MCDKTCDCKTTVKENIRTYQVHARHDAEKVIGRGALFPDGTLVHQNGDGFGDHSRGVVLHRNKDIATVERMHAYDSLAWND